MYIYNVLYIYIYIYIYIYNRLTSCAGAGRWSGSGSTPSSTSASGCARSDCSYNNLYNYIQLHKFGAEARCMRSDANTNNQSMGCNHNDSHSHTRSKRFTQIYPIITTHIVIILKLEPGLGPHSPPAARICVWGGWSQGGRGGGGGSGMCCGARVRAEEGKGGGAGVWG